MSEALGAERLREGKAQGLRLTAKKTSNGNIATTAREMLDTRHSMLDLKQILL
jgi:hypothetical protein